MTNWQERALYRGVGAAAASDGEDGATSSRNTLGDRRSVRQTKEVLGGFILIEARDIDEAVRIAANIPVGKFGSIEVRPEMKIGSGTRELGANRK